ncbi:hypothetical protein MMC20_001944 [Loxospora ochrophaea]|nr:hypothetical protein [Loxospora ochrophaea]
MAQEQPQKPSSDSWVLPPKYPNWGFSREDSDVYKIPIDLRPASKEPRKPEPQRATTTLPPPSGPWDNMNLSEIFEKAAKGKKTGAEMVAEAPAGTIFVRSAARLKAHGLTFFPHEN